MASLSAQTKEIPAVLDLIEQVFPVDLSAVKKMLVGVEIQGKVTLTKTIATEHIVIDLTITP